MQVQVALRALLQRELVVMAEQRALTGLQEALAVRPQPQPEVAVEVPQVMRAQEEPVVPLLQAQAEQAVQITHRILEGQVVRIKLQQLLGIRVLHPEVVAAVPDRLLSRR
jgi:hypothetical protein